MIYPIDSSKRFFGTSLEELFDAFHVIYVIKTREDNGELLESIVKTTVELDERKAAVAVNEQRLKEVAVAIVASDAKKQRR